MANSARRRAGARHERGVCSRSRIGATPSHGNKVTETVTERIANLQIERLYLATSDEVQGLMAQGGTITETIEIARELVEAATEQAMAPELRHPEDKFAWPTITV